MKIIESFLLLASNDSSFRLSLVPALAGTLIVLSLVAVYYWKTRHNWQPRGRRNWFYRAVYGAFLAAIIVLSVTSFGSILRFGAMQHYALLGHLTAAGAFVFLLLPISCIYLPRSLRIGHTWWLESCSAWVLIISSLATALTMMIGMLPAMNTNELLQLVEVHRYLGLTAAVSAVVHVFSLGIQRIGFG